MEINFDSIQKQNERCAKLQKAAQKDLKSNNQEIVLRGQATMQALLSNMSKDYDIMAFQFKTNAEKWQQTISAKMYGRLKK